MAEEYLKDFPDTEHQAHVLFLLGNLYQESGDYAVDRARGEYELELRTDLGTTMARLTRAQYLSARAEFNTALTWARLDGLLGKLAAPASATP